MSYKSNYKSFKSLIYSDVLEVICKHLLPQEIITLCQNYPKILKRIKYIFPQRVAQELDNYLKNLFQEKFTEFKNSMIKSNAYLSGSIILKLSYGKFSDVQKRFDKSDLDIFMLVNPIYINPKSYRTRYDANYTFTNYKHNYKIGYTELHNFCFKNNHKEPRVHDPHTYKTFTIQR